MSKEKTTLFIDRGNGYERLYTEQEVINNLQDEIERLQNVLNQIESALYNENLSNMNCRITIQEILDKANNDIELDMLKALNIDLEDDIEMG